MPETVRTIRAGSSAVYEVVYDPDGGTSVTIRHAENATTNSQSVNLVYSALPTLADILREVHAEMAR